MADALLGFIAHPFAIEAHILSQALRAHVQVCANSRPSLRASGLTGGSSGKFRRNFDHRLVDQDSHRVEVRLA
jgi:hypothetical protein